MRTLIVICLALSGLFGVMATVAACGKVESYEIGPYDVKGDLWFPAYEKQSVWRWGQNMPLSIMVIETKKIIMGMRNHRTATGSDIVLVPSTISTNRRVSILRRGSHVVQAEGLPYTYLAEWKPLLDVAWR